MANWYELGEEQRVKDVYSKYTISQFYDWWSDNTNKWMEVRIKDIDLIKEVATKLDLPWSASGVYVNDGNKLRNVIANVRDKATCWFGINPRKKNWNKRGKKSLGGKLVNVESINFLFIDIDRLVKQGPATSEELSKADMLVNRVLDKLREQGWANDYCKICSGNGVQLLVRLDYPIKIPNIEFDLKTNTYVSSEEFDNHCNLLRAKVGRQLVIFSNKFKDELGVIVDKACFNIAGVGSLPVTKNFKYGGYTWRGIIEIKKDGENFGLTDYILSGVTQATQTSIFTKSRKQDVADRLVRGKLREHPLVKFMLQELPAGERNNKLWFQFKCLVRDSKIDINSDEFRLIHKEIETKWNDSLTLNPPDKKFMFGRNIVNSYCVNHLLPPIYQPIWEERIAKRPTRLDKADAEYLIVGTDIPQKYDGASIEEDMKLFDATLKDNDYANVNKYGSFLKGCVEKYGFERTRYYATWVFPRQFCWQ